MKIKGKYRPTAKGYFSAVCGLETGVQQAGVQMVQSLDVDQNLTRMKS